MRGGSACVFGEKVGFRRVGVMRQYISVHDGPWLDALLVELLAEDLT
ncbi:MAG: hypothetical protein H0T78_06075 [Longispora sp.]|nr:hypothetical protein [Longispora sp. (in: high G+C Gram-positive bacteria)]